MRNRKSRRYLAFRSEALAAKQAFVANDLILAFHHLERAHILGQPWAGPHTWTHWMMLRVGWREDDPFEVTAQVFRLSTGWLLSLLGLLPVGNTGGGDVPATKPMPIPDDLQALMTD